MEEFERWIDNLETCVLTEELKDSIKTEAYICYVQHGNPWVLCSERQPTEPGKYYVQRKFVHKPSPTPWLETWNGINWARNHDDITDWLDPKLLIHK